MKTIKFRARRDTGITLDQLEKALTDDGLQFVSFYVAVAPDAFELTVVGPESAQYENLHALLEAAE